MHRNQLVNSLKKTGITLKKTVFFFYKYVNSYSLGKSQFNATFSAYNISIKMRLKIGVC